MGLLFLSSSTNDGWLVLLAGLGLGLVVAALVLHPRLDPLDVDVRLPDRTRVDDELLAEITVTNRGRRTSVPVTVTLMSPLLGQVVVRVPALEAGEAADASAPLTAKHRGEVVVMAVTVHTTAPFSLVAVTSGRLIRVRTLVHPLLDHPLADAPGGVGDTVSAVTTAAGVEVQGIREWHRGEATGRLYARGTARHGRPLVLDRHDGVGRPGVAFVVTTAADGDSRLVEPMLSVVAATLAERAAVGLDVTVVANQPGLEDVTSTDATELLDWCARLDRAEAPTSSHVERAAVAAGRGGDVVLAQLLSDERTIAVLTDVAARHGARLLVLHRFTDRTDALCLHEAGGTGSHHPGRPS